jgi:hypothetical protein
VKNIGRNLYCFVHNHIQKKIQKKEWAEKKVKGKRAESSRLKAGKLKEKGGGKKVNGARRIAGE